MKIIVSNPSEVKNSKFRLTPIKDGEVIINNPQGAMHEDNDGEWFVCLNKHAKLYCAGATYAYFILIKKDTDYTVEIDGNPMIADDGATSFRLANGGDVAPLLKYDKWEFTVLSIPTQAQDMYFNDIQPDEVGLMVSINIAELGAEVLSYPESLPVKIMGGPTRNSIFTYKFYYTAMAANESPAYMRKAHIEGGLLGHAPTYEQMAYAYDEETQTTYMCTTDSSSIKVVGSMAWVTSVSDVTRLANTKFTVGENEYTTRSAYVDTQDFLDDIRANFGNDNNLAFYMQPVGNEEYLVGNYLAIVNMNRWEDNVNFSMEGVNIRTTLTSLDFLGGPSLNTFKYLANDSLKFGTRKVSVILTENVTPTEIKINNEALYAGGNIGLQFSASVNGESINSGWWETKSFTVTGEKSYKEIFDDYITYIVGESAGKIIMVGPEGGLGHIQKIASGHYIGSGAIDVTDLERVNIAFVVTGFNGDVYSDLFTTGVDSVLRCFGKQMFEMYEPPVDCAPTILTVVPTLTSTSLNTSEQYTITYSVNNGPDVVASGLPVYTEPGFPTADPCLALSGLLRINDPTVNGVSYNSFFGFNFPTVEGYEVYDMMPENAASFTIKLKKTEPANLVGTDLVWLMFEQDEVIMHSCWFDTDD